MHKINIVDLVMAFFFIYHFSIFGLAEGISLNRKDSFKTAWSEKLFFLLKIGSYTLFML